MDDPTGNLLNFLNIAGRRWREGRLTLEEFLSRSPAFDVNAETAAAVLAATPFQSVDDLLTIEGISEDLTERLREMAPESSLSLLGPYLTARALPLSKYATAEFEILSLDQLALRLNRRTPSVSTMLIVVAAEEQYFVLDPRDRRFGDQILHLLHGQATGRIRPAITAAPTDAAVAVLGTVILQDLRHIVLLNEEGVAGLVRPIDLKGPTRLIYGGIDVSEREINTGTPDTPGGPYEAVPLTEKCCCAIILFQNAGGVGRPIDALTGGLQWSHAAIDCCEVDAKTGKRLMIDITWANGVHRTLLDTDFYAGRARARIGLPPDVCREVCACMKRKVGTTFDFTDFFSEDGEGDVDGTVCSQTIFECLPPRVQEFIRNANLELGFWGNLNKSWNPGIISPNQIAAAFGVPNAGEVRPKDDGSAGEFVIDCNQGIPPVMQPPTKPPPASPPTTPPASTSPGRCRVQVRLVRVRFKPGTDEIGRNWTFQFDVNGRGPSEVRAPDFGKHNEPLTPRKLIFDEERGNCGEDVPINIVIKAFQFQGVNDYGWNETDTPFMLRCPGEYFSDLEVDIRDWNDFTTLQFRFNITLTCDRAAVTAPSPTPTPPPTPPVTPQPPSVQPPPAIPAPPAPPPLQPPPPTPSAPVTPAAPTPSAPVVPPAPPPGPPPPTCSGNCSAISAVQIRTIPGDSPPDPAVIQQILADLRAAASMDAQAKATASCGAGCKCNITTDENYAELIAYPAPTVGVVETKVLVVRRVSGSCVPGP